MMKELAQLARQIDAAVRQPATDDAGRLREAMGEALQLEHPLAAKAAEDAKAAGRGKKAVVAAAVRTLLDLDQPEVVEALEGISRATNWRQARVHIHALGLAGEIIAHPQRRGLRLPCAPCACPSVWGTNWGLPNAAAVAEMLLRIAPAMPTSGDGWKLSR